uniref:WD_REPEATS_REGION domain-containing protein n=3 Tax=Macrostomum lignano TaxID=282301 RepID=A0A1I8J2D9_9PLAT
MDDAETERVQVSFVTKDSKFSVSNYPIYVQLDSGRGDLSDMVKSLLASDHASEDANSGPTPAEFEFLVQDELLVGSLRQLVEDRGLAMDAVLRAEYFPRRSAPAPYAELALGNLVSCVRARGRHLLVGCYDYSVAIGDIDGGTELSLKLPDAHEKEVKAVDWLTTTTDGQGDADSSCEFVSAGHDQDCRIWRWEAGAARCLAVCKGHASSVLCAAGSPGPAFGHFASGSFDGQVKLWRSSDEGTAAETGGISHQSKHSVPSRVPLRTLAGHRDAVHAVAYAGANQLFSGGADCSTRLWDVEVGAESALLRAPSAVLSLHSRPDGRALLAGCAGPQPRLYDPRSSGDTLIACFNAHDTWVCGVRWCPQPGSQLFASCGCDTVVKLWDLRCTKAPLYELRDHSGIVTSVDWSETGHVVSGSADCTVKIFKADLV